MGKIIDGIFLKNEVTPQEELDGRMLGEVQKMLLQNDLADYAQARLNLIYDPDRPLKFLQDEASLSSKIAYIQYLLDSSTSSQQFKLKLSTEK